MIEINNLTTNSVNENFLNKVAKKILEGEKQENRFIDCFSRVSENKGIK